MTRMTMLALGMLFAGNAFAIHQAASDDAGQICPDSFASVATCGNDKMVKPRDLAERSIRLAAVDTGDQPPCASDGVCNLAVCSAAQDPDCPKNLPPDAGAEPAATSISLTTVDCTDTQDQDIRAVAWNIVDDWINFERTIESSSGFNLGNCIHDRFKENARVICVQQTKCKKGGRCVMGRSSPLNHTTRIFGTFFNNIADAAQPDRRACYAAVLIHEFSHSCDRVFERPRAEAREAAAFTYWQKRFPGTSGWTRTGANGTGCGLD